jgi:hypothetical protein
MLITCNWLHSSSRKQDGHSCVGFSAKLYRINIEYSCNHISQHTDGAWNICEPTPMTSVVVSIEMFAYIFHTGFVSCFATFYASSNHDESLVIKAKCKFNMQSEINRRHNLISI